MTMYDSGNMSLVRMMLLGNELRNTTLKLELPESMQKMNMTKLITLAYIQEYEQDGVVQRDLETMLRIRRSSVSTLLGGLEQDGLILRIPVPEDARLKRVVLTEKGQEAASILAGHQKKLDAFVEDILTLEECETLGGLIKKLMSSIDARKEEEERKK